MSNVLITGARGFLGSALKKRLLQEHVTVFELEAGCDVSSEESFKPFDSMAIDMVFHLAGKTHVPTSWREPAAFYATNVVGTVNALDFCRRNNAAITYVSAYLYGIPEKLPIREDAPIAPNNPYAHTKHLAEQACRFYAKEYHVRTTILRPFNVFGAGQAERFLIPDIFRQAASEGEIRVNDLSPRRDFVYVDDLVEALVLTMRRTADFAVYNVGSGTSVSVREAIDAVQEALGTSKKVISENAARKNEINDVVADISLIREALGWRPAYSFGDGIRKMAHELGVAATVPINKGNYSMEPPDREALFEAYRGRGWEDGYEEYRKSWSNFALKKVVSEYPLLVDAELATICNLKCPMCYTITDEFKKKVNVMLMDFDLYKKIIDEISGHVSALRLSLRGEPTLHPRFIEAIRYAKDRGIKEVSFLTNGSRLTPDYFRQVLDAGADWITISVDGIGGVYEGIRKPLKFADTLNKIKEMKRIKSELDAVKPVVKVQSVWPAIKDNPEAYYDTLAPYVDLVAFNPLIDYLGLDSNVEYEEGFSCPQQYQRLVIGADGSAMMCSNDEEGTVIVGDAKVETIRDIWHGDRLNAVRATQGKRDGFKEIDVCRRCYLPRKIDLTEKAAIHNREFIVRNYINRSQVIGR